MLDLREFFKKWCNLVRFGVYLDQILKNTIFYIKISKIQPFFLYKKRNILDTRLLWGNSHEEIFENILRLIRFGVNFEIILNRKWLFSCRNNDVIVACIF